MSISLEPITSDLLLAPTIMPLVQGRSSDAFKQLELCGGFARIVCSDGEPVGFVMVTAEHEIMLAMDSLHRRKGIGTEALRLAMLIASAAGMTSLTASTQAGTASNGLLAKVGASEVRRDADEIHYAIDLPK